MESTPDIRVIEGATRGNNESSSLFKNLRQSMGVRILAVATALGAMGASACKDRHDYRHSDPAAISSAPVFGFGNAPDAAAADGILRPDAETIKKQETITTDDCLESAIENFSEVFETSAGAKDGLVPIFYTDPYKCFKIVRKARMPAGKKNGEMQAFHDGQRKLISADPENNLVRVRTHDENPDRELPIVASVKQETSLATAIMNARSRVTVPFSSKQMPLIDAIGWEIDKVFPSTGLYKDLRALRSGTVETELAQKKKDAIVLEKRAAELKRRGSNEANEELKTVKTGLFTLYMEIINLDKERRKPGLYTDGMRGLLLYGLLPQENVYTNRTSGKDAKGPWQIKKAACEQVLGEKGCAKANLGNLSESTNIAIKYFDYMYGFLKKDISDLEKAYGISDPTSLLIPCLITAYTAGPDRAQAMIGWFLKNADPSVKEKVGKGEISGENLFMYMSISFYHANSYDRENYGLDGKYGQLSLNYYAKIEAWARIMPDYIHTEAGDKLLAEAEEAEKASATPAPQASASAPKVSASSPKASASTPAPSVSAPKKTDKKEAPAAHETKLMAKGKPCGLKDDEDHSIPEKKALTSATHKFLPDSPVGNIKISSSFMEVSKHSLKPPQKAIFKDGTLEQLPAAKRNLGIDYVPQENWKIVTWYGGTVEWVGRQGAYGNRIIIKTNVTYKLNGKDYIVYQAYAHAAHFLDNMKEGQQVGQFEHIGRMGSTGGDYGAHIDLRTYIWVNGERVDLSLHALENQLQG